MDHTVIDASRNHFIVYCHTNKINGKRYVGQTLGTMKNRWRQHVREAASLKSRRPFHAAIRKYGPEAFTHEVLDTAATEGAANTAELYWIARYGTVKPNGYNLDSGGGRHPDTRQKISACMTAQLMSLSPENRSRRAAHATRAQWENMTAERRLSRNAKISVGRKAFMAALSSEERSALVRKSNASRTPAERSRCAKIASEAAFRATTPEQRRRSATAAAAVARKNTSYEQRSEWGRRGASSMLAKTTREDRVRQGRAAAATRLAATTAEQRREIARRGQASLTPNQRSEIARKRNAAMTPAQRSERSLRAAATRRARTTKRPLSLENAP
jgi:group I intron endonuclease